jgi:hypothetical protein
MPVSQDDSLIEVGAIEELNGRRSPITIRLPLAVLCKIADAYGCVVFYDGVEQTLEFREAAP